MSCSETRKDYRDYADLYEEIRRRKEEKRRERRREREEQEQQEREVELERQDRHDRWLNGERSEELEREFNYRPRGYALRGRGGGGFRPQYAPPPNPPVVPNALAPAAPLGGENPSTIRSARRGGRGGGFRVQPVVGPIGRPPPPPDPKPFQTVRYKAILGHSDSVGARLQSTVDGLANEFAREQTAEDVIFELFKLPNKEQGAIGKLLAVLKSYGIQDTDPRLKRMMAIIWEIERRSEERTHEAKDPRHWRLSRADFCRCVAEALDLVSRTLRNQLVIPSWAQFCATIGDIYRACAPLEGGRVATSIPQLARADPRAWAVAVCTVDGQRVAFGDARLPFCMQSLSKAFNYAITASDLGADFVHKHVGQEPSGRLLNELCLDAKNIPHNPLISSGAIVVASLLKSELNMADRFDCVLHIYRKIAGGEHVGFNNAAFLSERAHSDRNFALAHYLNEYKCFPPAMRDLHGLMDFYFQLQALETTTESAAVMAATLANGGICPLTEERVIESRPCRDLLSLMHSCGMYDYSGQFAFHVGLPAKSSTAGAMIVVVPGLFGVCLYAPPLDECGNSVRGVEFCRRLITAYNLHNYDDLLNSERDDPRRRVGEQERDEIVSMLFAARSNDLNALRRIFLRPRADLARADYDQRTPLHVAAAEGHAEEEAAGALPAAVSVDTRGSSSSASSDSELAAPAAVHFTLGGARRPSN
ncbi:No extended memory [Aphelenchoides fujianensis]|nr:No extended memory [Aphelenchoides fujianensis]